MWAQRKVVALLFILQNVDGTLIFPFWSIENWEESISSSAWIKVEIWRFWGVVQFLALKKIALKCTMDTKNNNVILNIVGTGLACFFGEMCLNMLCTTAAQPVAQYVLSWVLFEQQLSEKLMYTGILLIFYIWYFRGYIFISVTRTNPNPTVVRRWNLNARLFISVRWWKSCKNHWSALLGVRATRYHIALNPALSMLGGGWDAPSPPLEIIKLDPDLGTFLFVFLIFMGGGRAGMPNLPPAVL